jgi:hypothetical protein
LATEQHIKFVTNQVDQCVQATPSQVLKVVVLVECNAHSSTKMPTRTEIVIHSVKDKNTVYLM